MHINLQSVLLGFMVHMPSLQELDRLDMSDPKSLYALIEFIRQIGKGQEKTLAEHFEISKEVVEDFYGIAKHLFEQQNYKRAQEMFEQLIQLDILNYKYAYGAGACCQAMRLYPFAIIYYSLAYQNKPDEPLPPFYAADCCIAYGNQEMAKKFLQIALENLEKKPELAEIKQQAALMLQGLEAF